MLLHTLFVLIIIIIIITVRIATLHMIYLIMFAK